VIVRALMREIKMEKSLLLFQNERSLLNK